MAAEVGCCSPVVLVSRATDELGHALVDALVHELQSSGLRVTPLPAGGWLRIAARLEDLLDEAFRLGVRKEALDPTIGMIKVSASSLHLLAFGDRPDELFTSAEAALLTLSLIRRPVLSEGQYAALPPQVGRARGLLRPGISLAASCEALAVAQLVLPHNESRRAALSRAWIRPRLDFRAPLLSLTAQPIDQMRKYLGPTEVTFYFDLLGAFTRALALPCVASVVLGTVSMLLPQLVSAAAVDVWRRALASLYGVGLAIWSACFVESWRRQECRRALEWGTLDSVDADLESMPRVGFVGTEMVWDPLHQRFLPSFSEWHRFRRYCVTVPVTGAMLAVVGLDMWLWLWAHYEAARRWPEGSKWLLRQLPTVGYCASVSLLSALYRPVAGMLTAFENHRTDEAQRNALIGRCMRGPGDGRGRTRGPSAGRFWSRAAPRPPLAQVSASSLKWPTTFPRSSTWPSTIGASPSYSPISCSSCSSSK